jgi:flagellar basal-body rod modification protein FlgD
MQTTATTTATAAPPTNVLDQNSFLQLLTAQLSNQDPTDPMSSSDFTTQLAQLTQVQAITQLNASFSDLLTLQQMTQGANLLGRTAVYTSGSQGNVGQGTVTGVSTQNGSLQLLINGQAIPLSQVSGFAQNS